MYEKAGELKEAGLKISTEDTPIDLRIKSGTAPAIAYTRNEDPGQKFAEFLRTNWATWS